MYEQIAGVQSPVKKINSSTILKDLDDLARKDVAEDLGHSRKQITAIYIG